MSLLVDIRARVGGFDLAPAFETAETGVTALFGPSGSGKSLTLAAVAGALKPRSGRIVADGEVLFDAGARIDRPMEARGVGWAFQDGRLFPHLDVEANLRYGQKRARSRPVRTTFDEVVEVLDIGPLLRRRSWELSGGERQRVGIGRALLSQPRLLLMDEPLSALDAARKAEILPFLERLKAFGLPILYVTHSLSEVLRLGDRLVVLDRGATLAQGPLAEVVSRTDLPMLAARVDTAAVLDAVVAAHDERRGLSRLDADGVTLLTPRLNKAAGAGVRTVVLARDVLLSTAEPVGLSARNVLKGRVETLTTRGDGSVLVRVALSPLGPRLLSAITRDAVEALGLEEGSTVWAIVKSVAVEGASGGLLAALDD